MSCCISIRSLFQKALDAALPGHSPQSKQLSQSRSLTGDNGHHRRVRLRQKPKPRQRQRPRRKHPRPRNADPKLFDITQTLLLSTLEVSVRSMLLPGWIGNEPIIPTIGVCHQFGPWLSKIIVQVWYGLELPYSKSIAAWSYWMFFENCWILRGLGSAMRSWV